MKISGFSFVRDGVSLYYPVAESIRSVLPLVDEFVVAVGECRPGDATRRAIMDIDSPKVRILDTQWDPRYFRRGAINAVQTDIAKQACTGDWLLYLQADEVIHEQYLPGIRRRMEALLPDSRVEALLFRFRHFWADYDHCMDSHAWYAHEIRAIRNLPEIHSWHSAQSFRYFTRYEHPHQTSDARKLNVADVDAEVYHYGWVRPPRLMQKKNQALNSVHAGPEQAARAFAQRPPRFCFGPLDDVPRFTGTHPAVMRDRISAMDWQAELQESTRQFDPGDMPRHRRLKYRVLTWFERHLFGGEQVFGSRNYRRVRGVPRS